MEGRPVTRLARVLGSLLVSITVGTILVTPASSTTPPWLRVGAYASYKGTYAEPTVADVGEYLRIRMEFNWNVTGLS